MGMTVFHLARSLSAAPDVLVCEVTDQRPGAVQPGCRCDLALHQFLDDLVGRPARLGDVGREPGSFVRRSGQGIRRRLEAFKIRLMFSRPSEVCAAWKVPTAGKACHARRKA